MSVSNEIMGVRGLQTYIENYCPDACYEVNIRDLIHTFRCETGRQPVIVVDGSSCIRYIYGSLDWVLGGQLKEYADNILNFIKAFESLGAKLVFYFDGTTVGRKRPVWVERRQNDLQKVYKLFDSLREWKNLSHVDHDLFVPPPGLGTRSVIKDVCNCEVFTSIRECDEEIAEYARNGQCFAILGQDTDYIIYEGAQYYLSILKLNLLTMTTLNYNRWGLARHLAIHPDQLPILASLIGNDIVPANDLKAFHIDICRPTRQYTMNSRIPYQILFTHVARFVQTLPHGQSLFHALPQIAHRVLRDEQRAAQLGASIRSYHTTRQSEEPVESKPKDHWSQLMSLARRRHIQCENPSQMWGVLNELLYEVGTGVEDFREGDLPPTALALRPLRQRIYGLLLHEKPRTSHHPIVVTEWCMHGKDSLSQPARVEPVSIPGVPHPGLLTLWNEGSEDLRWRVFTAAISPRLDPNLLRELPPCLVIPAAVLSYICHELARPMLETWEVEVLITVAVVMGEYDTKQLAELKMPNVCTRAVRVSTLFTRSATAMHILLATCGYPITMAEALLMKYFDGKFFGFIYNAVKHGAKYEELCFHKVVLMEQYQKVRQFVFGSPQN